MTTLPFNEADFTADAYGHGPADKARVANQLVRLVRGNFRPTLFPGTLYQRLSLMFGHIAEYDRHGFYAVWLSSPAKRATWLRYVERGGAYGFHPEHRTDTWGDVERAFAAWVRDSGEAERQEALAASEVEVTERAELARLQGKYGS